MFTVTLASNAPSPLYVVWEHRFSFSAQAITYVFAAYAIGVLLSLFLTGPLSDQVGRRIVMVPALVLVDLGALLFATAGGLPSLVAARAIQGFATGAFTAAATASLMELTDASDKRAVSSLNTLCFVAGAATGPLLFGFLVQYAPWPRQLPFLVEMVLVTTAVFLLRRVPETVRRSGRVVRRIRKPSVPNSIRLPFVAASLAVALSWGVGALYGSLSPSIDADLLHVRTHLAAGAVLAAFFALAGLSQMAWRGGPSWLVMLVGVVGLALGMVLLGLGPGLRSAQMFAVATVFAGAGSGLAFMGSMGLVNNASPLDKRAEVLAAYNGCGYVALSVPILGVGAAAARLGLRDATQIFAAAVVGLAVLSIALSWRVRRVDRADAPAPLVAGTAPDGL